MLNLFRDQLDRYGEIDHTQDVIAQALALSPTTTLIFNADDPLCASIADRVPNPSLPFGLDGPTGGEASHIAESRFCAHCNAPLEYDYIQYGQLGSYHCPACGWRRPDLASGASNVHLTSTGYSFELKAQQDGSSQTAPLSTRYNGLYMVYNITAAWTAAWVLDALDGDSSRFQGVLDTYVPTGGRMTRWQAKGRIVATDLAKNPVGFDRQIQQVKASGGKLMAFYLNDADADGRDVSWIWDVDFECLSAPGVHAFAGGSRAHDLQVRLKYAGIDASLVNSIGDVIDTLAGEDVGEVLHAVANYTAFPPIVKELEGLGDVVTGDAKTVSIDVTAIHDDDDTQHSDKMLDLGRPLRIVHLYPDALNLYGDGGNAIILERRCRWRGIPVEVDDVHMGDVLDLSTADIVLIGGGADRDQLAVANELRHQRDELQGYVEDDGVVLAICGSYQLLGRSYYMGDEKVEGLGIIAADTVRGEGRLTGNVAVKTDIADAPFVGFENHGGRTVLDACEHPLGTSVLEGTGNNGQDGSEGCLHRNLVGTYLHGPALSKNPELADWLITRALERRGRGGNIQARELLPLAMLDDACEHAAHEAAMKLLG